MTRLDKAGRARFGAVMLAIWLGIGVAGCSSLLDVDNPNNVSSEDVRNPSAAQAVANGALYQLQAGYTYMLMVYSQTSDELHWCGSRDNFQTLDFGHLEDPLNEFTDQAFKDLAPARWMADEAIEILEEHRANADLDPQSALGEAYLWGAINYVVIADWFDDFVFSDMREPFPPIGEDKMGGLYDDAIGYLDNALALNVSGDLRRNLMAMRARAKHARGVWNKVGQRPISTGLIPASDAAAAAADAQAAISMDAGDWTFVLEYIPGGTYGDIQGDINSRLEHRFGDRYIIPQAAGKRRDRTAADRGIALQDPIAGVGDPRLDAFMTPFEDAIQYSDLPLLSAREMHLILAEDALVRGAAAEFETHINNCRALGGMAPWTDDGAGPNPTAQAMLIYERQVNLFLQGRRLNDMYRFGIQSDRWQAASAAASAPGTFFPITKAEIDANCYINPDWPKNVTCPPS